MTNPQDSTFGAFLGFVACLGTATAVWLIAHHVGQFHRRGVARLRAHRTRQETTTL